MTQAEKQVVRAIELKHRRTMFEGSIAMTIKNLLYVLSFAICPRDNAEAGVCR